MDFISVKQAFAKIYCTFIRMFLFFFQNSFSFQNEYFLKLNNKA